jgi:hypothetical protein
MMAIRTCCASLVLLTASWGCAVAPLPPSSPHVPSAPLFLPTPEDTIRLAALASELEAMAIECAAAGACEDQLHFSRALVSLFENQDAARSSFQEIITNHPSSPFAASSALWLQVLQEEGFSSPSHNPYRRILTELTAQWARESVARQLSLQSPPAKTLGTVRPVNLEAIYKQVRERDRRIAELRAQLDALRVIDQDQQDRHQNRRPSALRVVPKIEQQR